MKLGGNLINLRILTCRFSHLPRSSSALSANMDPVDPAKMLAFFLAKFRWIKVSMSYTKWIFYTITSD